jgi:large subunit ribosomal protein L5
MSRLRERYEKEVVPGLKKEFGYDNVMAIPKITKVVVNMGLGEATQNAKIVDTGADELGRITGQKPVVTRAKKSIAQFKVRKGMPIGTMVTLRGERMWEFLDRLIAVALPRVATSAACSPKGFDGRGNYTLGLKDQLLFPEIDYMKVDKAARHEHLGVTTAKTDEESRKLLQLLGVPSGRRKRSESIRWPLPPRSPKKPRRRSSRSGCATAASAAAGRAPSCASSPCAACASASWRSRATSPE